MTLCETIYARRQVRDFKEEPLDAEMLENIRQYVAETNQLTGQQARFEIVPAEAVNGGSNAPHYLLSYCADQSAAYANVGYILQKADLYMQSMGLGSGWFMSPKPKNNSEDFCIALAFGNTAVPMRKNADEFKRLPVEKISQVDNAVARAVRLAPSAMNSQPWSLEFAEGKVIIRDLGRGAMRLILKNKLNKIDVGIAARHAVTALEQEDRIVTDITPRIAGKDFEIEILYQ